MTVECTGDPGNYTASLDISGVTANPMSVMAEQGGRMARFLPSPANDQEGPASAPTATTPIATISGDSHNLSIICNEVGEVVSITGSGLNPNPQTHTCTGSGVENFLLNLEQGINFRSPNILMLSSTDQYGNQASGTTTVDVPISTLGPSVFIATGGFLPNIDASNAQSFRVEGTCSEEGEPVMVSVGTGVGAVSPQTAPNCTSGLWLVSLDVTSLNKTSGEIPITADHSSSGGVDAIQALEEITNTFVCPGNFVGVPSLTGYTTNSFCVMKYEAKNDGSNNAISQAEGSPYVSLNHDDSREKCQDIATGYDLITNDEWQSIARNIELVGSNWDTGTVGSSGGDFGGLNRGHSDGIPTNALEANSDDNNACHATGQHL